MSIDMAQFHQVFFEESFEGIEVMETGLMELEPGSADSEVINSIFRAAHSIKGGSGTFGFKAIADFTHVMETLLDEMRDGKREVTDNNSDILLRSVDCLREMLEAAQADDEPDAERVQQHQAELEKELGSTGQSADSTASTSTTSTDEDNTTKAPDSSKTIWEISFKPHNNLFQTGNDPIPLIKELSTLGEVELTSDFSQIPEFETMDVEECYSAWNIKLTGDVEKHAIDEIFAWVEDNCDLEIKQIAGTSKDKAVSKTESGAADSEVAKTLPVPQRRAADQGDAKGGDRRKKDRRGSAAQASASIRVDTDKIDALINMVGELVITQSMLGMVGEKVEENRNVDAQDIEKLRDGLMQLERNTRELQESVMQVRMMPISFTFSRFPRLVRDLSNKLGKKIQLVLSGETTEVDKTVIEKIGDPMVHLVRNSLDHGIEMPEDRVAAGKDELGTINLNAFHQGGNIVIEIIDDGKGMDKDVIYNKGIEKGLINEGDILTDRQIFELIFLPGFSTAAVVSDVSGRGVGMDVVRRNIQELGGSIEIDSKLGQGSTMRIRLPLTLAILDGQTVTVAKENYIIPIISIVESIQIQTDMINMVGGKGETFKLRDEYIPIIKLHDVFGVKTDKAIDLKEGLLVVVEAEGTHVGLFVDELLGQQQVVIKSLEHNYKKIEGFSGATILGDGSVALIIDMPGILKLNKHLQSSNHKQSTAAA